MTDNSRTQIGKLRDAAHSLYMLVNLDVDLRDLLWIKCDEIKDMTTAISRWENELRSAS